MPKIGDAPAGEKTSLDGTEKIAITGSKWALISRLVAYLSGEGTLATKSYVDGIAANLGKRQRVRAATTTNITIATALNNGDTLDGVSLATGDLVLVKDQSAAEQNGVYLVGASPARSSEFDTYDEHPGSLIAVQEGTLNAETVWLCTSNVGGTLNTTAIDFSPLSAGGGSGIAEDLTTAETDTSKRLAPDGAGGVAWVTGGGGGGTDLDVSPNPTADDEEFKAALSGWTTLGSPDVIDANTLASNLHISIASPGTFQIHGGYKAAPSMPFTVTAKLSDYRVDANFQQQGFILAESSPGKIFFYGPIFQSSNGTPEMIVGNWASRTSRSSVTEYGGTRHFPQYIRMVVNSSSSVDLYYSMKGLVWVPLATAYNPGFTIGNIGFGISGNDNNVPVELFVDWMRFGTDVVRPDAELWQNL